MSAGPFDCRGNRDAPSSFPPRRSARLGAKRKRESEEKERREFPFFDSLPDELVVEILAVAELRSRSELHRTCLRLSRLREAVRNELRARCGMPESEFLRFVGENVYNLCEFDGLLAAGHFNGEITLRNSDGAVVRTFGEEQSVRILTMVEFDGKLAAGFEDGEIRLWSREGACATTLSEHPDWAVWCLCVFGELLASGSDDKTIKLWDKSGACVKTLSGHGCSVFSLVAFEGFLASGSEDETVKLWDVSSGACVRTLTGHEGPVWCLCVFAGFLVSGSEDKALRWWDSSGACAKVLRGHPEEIRSIASSDRLLASACSGTTKFWNSEGECLRTIDRDCDFYQPRPLLFWRGTLVEVFDEKLVL